ncbi:MAG TPA: hypothetical protein PLX89_14080 [Verrucomicrobiota bacterium]|nr:hypothetical protein [Verrucomicrobiales bacterium]HRI14121.1 hypothetical protein [Verrucomicrobiota bacterium]
MKNQVLSPEEVGSQIGLAPLVLPDRIVAPATGDATPVLRSAHRVARSQHHTRAVHPAGGAVHPPGLCRSHGHGLDRTAAEVWGRALKNLPGGADRTAGEVLVPTAAQSRGVDDRRDSHNFHGSDLHFFEHRRTDAVPTVSAPVPAIPDTTVARAAHDHRREMVGGDIPPDFLRDHSGTVGALGTVVHRGNPDKDAAHRVRDRRSETVGGRTHHDPWNHRPGRVRVLETACQNPARRETEDQTAVPTDDDLLAAEEVGGLSRTASGHPA